MRRKRVVNQVEFLGLANTLAIDFNYAVVREVLHIDHKSRNLIGPTTFGE